MISYFVPRTILSGPLTVTVVAFVMLQAAVAHAQGFESVGTRAAGMGQAFVAVADDATATWWNPAGLPASLIFDAAIEWGGLNSDRSAPIERAGTEGQSRTFGLAVAFPVAGGSYVRLRQWRLDPPATVGVGGVRQEGGRVSTARSLLTQHVGFSLAQSLGDAVVVGVTGRAIWGSVSVSDASGTVGLSFDRAAEGPSEGTMRGDLDAGVLARVARLRLGLSARNLTEPEFDGPDGVPWRLERRVRAGVAFVADADRPGRQPWTVSADADLTVDDEVGGGWRGLGVGAEKWVAGRRVAVRGGVSASTHGEARTTGTCGLSVAVPGGFFLEAAGAFGARERRGWGLTAHVTF
jgi:hypothetical protein